MIKLTLDELMERWEMLHYEMGIEKLLITENLFKRRERQFIVCGLTMELIDDFAICYDDEDVIIDNECLIMMFLRHQLTDIYLIPVDYGTGYVEKLEFGNYGTVYINKAS